MDLEIFERIFYWRINKYAPIKIVAKIVWDTDVVPFKDPTTLKLVYAFCIIRFVECYSVDLISYSKSFYS